LLVLGALFFAIRSRGVLKLHEVRCVLAHEASHHTLTLNELSEPAESPTDVTDGPPAINTGSVTSGDGTLIGYRQIGDGTESSSALRCRQSSANLLALARALMYCFTVCVPDRRGGLGMSGPYAEVDGWRTHRQVLCGTLQPLPDTSTPTSQRIPGRPALSCQQFHGLRPGSASS